MTTISPRAVDSARKPDGLRAPVSLRRTVRLSLVHARFNLLETIRVPIAVIGSLVFPALALLFFVVPQRAVADDPLFATQAIISLAVFAVMSNGLFGFGISIAENREKPWDPYLRTLPAPGIVRVAGLVLATGTLGLVAIVPLVVIGALLTAAEASIGHIVLGFVMLAVSGLPSMFLGMAIGLSFPSKAAIAVVQVAMFALAFGGGLFLPPVMFPGWLDTVTRFLPTRQARELVIWAVQGGALEWWAPVGAIVSAGVLLALVLLLLRRDQGRRFR
ncbi:ABC-2 type transport system permease protein [Labedella gwakjiensis]|uniref:ABC transporter permease n=1 Tax=Labedella gwakjiensis TaxID=390269 RepID=A0A2P8GR99_9MICO|nr:ABC transporter permease [Labedella gwakjiensis]PSL36464.1 ABC-2 type transport system permease protein [Labedella gwakjiensis]RUQ85612.1 ABC transporter permease [Labedella gwakjiensis]